MISVARIAGILAHNAVQCVREIDFLHKCRNDQTTDAQ
jgi:hypothetical protein